MTDDHADQLREAFETHHQPNADPAEVYARVQTLARGYLWRRRGVQAAGGAVLTAGVIAGAFQLPALMPAGNSDTANSGSAIVAAAGSPSSPTVAPAPSATPSESPTDKAIDAFFAAGYDYQSAVKLSKIWKISDITRVKAKAGKELLAGKKLPIKPEPGEVQSATELKRVNAFFDAGYTYNDAVKLAKIWNTKDPYTAKVLGGKKLLAGQTLPIKP